MNDWIPTPTEVAAALLASLLVTTYADVGPVTRIYLIAAIVAALLAAWGAVTARVDGGGSS